MPSFDLPGCSPTPLAAYLKALGVLRILASQCPEAESRARWVGNAFVLDSSLDRAALSGFFLQRYTPSPVVAPWNGGSGFYPKDNSTALEAIASSVAPRFAAYRQTIAAARAAIASLDLTEKPEKDAKERLLLRCRNTFSDDALEWIDSAFVITDGGAKYPPLLGTGGNDGRLEFTNNFMQRLSELFALDDAAAPATAEAAKLLDNALFGTPARGLVDKPIGQFSPAAGGGANASTGFDAKSALNPWDFVFALEGAMLFAAATLKRLEGMEPGQLVYPFCVQPSGSGYGSSSGSDESDARCEIWMPLWDSASSLSEIRNLLSEGRAWVARRPAKNGVDFALAVASLGVDRGIAEFQRYGFHVRNGLAYFATPLQRLQVRRNHVAADLLSYCDGWIQRFFSKAKTATAPGSIKRAARRLEAAILAQCSAAQDNNPLAAEQLIIALGECERTLVGSSKWTAENYVAPVPPLSPEWIKAAESDCAEYRLAAALASLGLWVNKQFFPFRKHLDPVKLGPGFPAWANWDDGQAKELVASEGSAFSLLNNIMRRRLLLAPQTGSDAWPEFARITAWPADIAAFVEGRFDEDRFIRLLWGLCLVGFPDGVRIRTNAPSSDALPPAFFGQLKLCFAARLPEDRKVPINASIFHLAARGEGQRASEQALRRLHGSSVPVAHVPISISGAAAERAAAALVFPLWDRQLSEVCASIAPLLFRQPANV